MARTPSRRTTDEHAFPVRVRFLDREGVPDSIRWSVAEAWLVEKLGRGHFAKHGDGRRYDLYFCTAEAAHQFLVAFPHFTLFDMTEQVDYLRAARSSGSIDLGTFADLGKSAIPKTPEKRAPPPKPAPPAMPELNLPDLRREVENIAGGKGVFHDVSQPRDFRAFTPAPLDARLRDVGPVRAPSERMKFGRWLVRQDNRSGLIGQLADCARADRAFPLDGSPEVVREHLRRAMADGDMFAAVDEAEIDWENFGTSGFQE